MIVARQAPLPMELSRQAYKSGLPYLLQGIFPIQRLNLSLLHCRQILYHLSDNNSSKNKISPTTFSSVQFSSVTQSCPTLCDPMDSSKPGLPVHHQLPEFTQIHVHWVGDAFQPSCPLLSPSPPALNLTQHQCLFKWVSSSYQVGKVLELQLQHQSIQWTSRTDLL